MFTKASELKHWAFFVEKMANVHRQKVRREKAQADRLQIFIADYVKCKYKTIHEEAVEYYNMLRERNPAKIDLKKTEEYRAWAKFQDLSNLQGPQKDNSKNPQQKDFHLEIPLLNLATTQKNSSILETVTVGIIDEGNINSIEPSLGEELPEELIDEIITELRQYPELENIFTALGDQIDFEELELGMDIELDNDDRLEQELW